MIAACPECRTQYRVDPGRLSGDGVRLRCTQCQTVFRVRAPEVASEPPASPEVQGIAPPAPEPSPAAPEPSPAAAPSGMNPPAPQALEASSSPTDPSPPPADVAPPAPAPVTPPEGNAWNPRLVLVATPDAESAKRCVETLQSWGLEAESAHDGVEALLKIHRLWPAAVVLDPQLPKMFGFQVCEVVKRNETLRRIGVVLIGAIHHPDRYRRNPQELYGADAYVEEPDLPEGLAPILRDLGLPLSLPVEGAVPGASFEPPQPPPVPAAAAPPAPELTAPPMPAAAPDPGMTMPPPIPVEAAQPAPAASQPGPAASPTVPDLSLPPAPPADLTLPPAPDLTVPPAPEAAAPAMSEFDIPDPDATAVSPAPMEAAVAPEPVPPAPPPAVAPPLEAVAAEPEPIEFGTEPVEPAPGAMPEPLPELEPFPEAEAAAPVVEEAEVASIVEEAGPVLEEAAPVLEEAAPVVEEATAAAEDPAFEQAERLARIIVSDVVLYNEDKFRTACEAGNVVEAMEADLADGRAHFASRVPEHVRNARDFLADELMRVARSRGMA